jgi:hypothetical protein
VESEGQRSGKARVETRHGGSEELRILFVYQSSNSLSRLRLNGHRWYSVQDTHCGKRMIEPIASFLSAKSVLTSRNVVDHLCQSGMGQSWCALDRAGPGHY